MSIQNKMNTFNQIKLFFGTFVICLTTGVTQPVQAAFDPVNDDTDIFLANPANAGSRPNVLLFVDNTANWNTAFTNEKNALVSVVNGLSDEFNVGLMMYPETGSPNDNIDGAYLRFGVRQMTTANKAVLADDVNGLDIAADKGNNNTLSEGMVEVYRYFKGLASIGSHGKIKTDFTGNASNLAGGLTGNALPANPNSGSLYNSPITDACQDSFVIYISNGGANENNSSLTKAEAELSAAGYPTSSTISLTPNGQEGSWMDEWAKFLASSDINGAAAGEPHIYTYVVEVDPVATGQGDDMTALMKSVASNGKGEYFSVSSGGAGTGILNALNAIFQEIQAVNSVFAAATLPVSVNVRGTNLNQVYIGVFRPDATKQPRWFGNLKAYKLGFDSVNSELFLADSQTDGNGDPVSAENATTGFIESSAISHWTSGSSFWGFRDASENGDGADSDSPDGDLVEKGGSAQTTRVTYATSQATRKLYTCTTGPGTNPDCDSSGDALSATLFATSNDDLDAAALGLGTTVVENLTGFETNPVNLSINDSQEVTGLTTVAAVPITITGYTTAAVNANISSIVTGGPQNITSITNDPTTNQITLAVRGGAANKLPITITTQNAHGLAATEPVSITGFTGDPEYNGNFTVIAVTPPNVFTYNNTGGTPGANPSPLGKIGGTSSSVTVTLPSHGFSNGDTVTIAGVTPTSFNGTYLNINSVTTNTFKFNTVAPLAPLDTANGIGTAGTAAGPSSIATATTAAAHGLISAANARISGAAISAYNGTYLVISTPTTTTFTYDHSNIGLAAEGAGAKVAQSQGSKTITGTVADGTFPVTVLVGDTITITGAATGYNGTHTITGINTAANPDEFTFEPTNPLPATTVVTSAFSAGANTTTATATVPGHGFTGTPTVTISGATPTEYNGSFTIAVTSTDTFTYDVSPATPVPATGTIAVRLGTSTADITANVTQTAHGYAAGQVITVAGATPIVYNGEFTILAAPVPTANAYSYTVTGENTAQGLATGTITSSTKTTTAFATVTNHGLGDGSGATDVANTVTGVTISGANIGVFNKTTSVIVIDSDTFKYTIAWRRGADTSSSITASFGTVSGSAVADLINWVRGADNTEDENADTSLTDIRASVHGDVLHSRPSIVNYNRHGNDEDVYIFYGANDGVFRAVKGGLGSAASGAGEPLPGHEAWGFIPKEHFGNLARLRNNSPTISSSFKKPYFMDGSLGTYVNDDDGDGILGETDDKVWIFTSNHRGGRFIYALDVTDPAAPKYLWSRSNNDAGWHELGQTWSVPQVRNIAAHSGPVLIFGAGYDPFIEDLDPEFITAVNTTTAAVTNAATPATLNPGGVTYAGANYNRAMGRGIFVVNAETGDIIVQIGPAAASGSDVADAAADHDYITVPEMLYAVPSDLAILTDRNNSSGDNDNRMYFGDTGGNLWRVDMADATVTNWKVTKIANISDTTLVSGKIPGLRKFLFPPDVVYGDGDQNGGSDFDSILIGSGDREHPFDDNVQNRFYMFKDESTGPLASADTPATQNLTESSLFDATSNCIQADANCSGSGDEADAATAAAALVTDAGWYITLLPGEKVVGNAVTLGSVTFFNTNEPSSAGSSTSCDSDLGTARQYQVVYANATVLEDTNYDGSKTSADRSQIKPGGGYLPSPVPVVVEIDGVIHEGVISGTSVDAPPGTTIGARLRKFWFKEVED